MRRIAMILTTLTLSALLLTSVASAQYYGSTPMNGSAAGVSFTPGSESMDPTNSVTITTGVLDGAITGTPITGGLHIEEVRIRPIDAPSGSLSGQFTIADGYGSSIAGDLNGSFSVGPMGTNASGSFNVTSGTGRFAGASGSGSFSESVSDPSAGGSSVTFTSAAINVNGPGAVPGGFPGVVPGASASAAGYGYNGLASPGYVPPTTYSQPYVMPNYYDPSYGTMTQQQAQALAAAEAAARAVVTQQQQLVTVPSGDMTCMTAITQNQQCNSDDPSRTPQSSATNKSPRR